ncbi:hypothetical protein [Brevibacillus dissolubilis]|uniref:hypothetical protein n=1 Tax=Brevibacillus dissolubilis TaxID=1844116 RepID=UPI0011161CE3|nr:hypothetical protein [Brevibacillus dissolubilis]
MPDGSLPDRSNGGVIQAIDSGNGLNPINLDFRHQFVMHHMDITVTGPLPNGTIQNEDAIALVDYSLQQEGSANNGYPMIRVDTMPAWINKLGGNFSFITSQITAYIITLKDGSTLEVVSLAQLINLCGGKGADNGLRPVSSTGIERYRAYANFEQTPVPTATIGPLLTNYPLNQSVAITGQAQAYSAYARFVVIDNFTVRKIDPADPANPDKVSHYTIIEPPGQKGELWDNTSDPYTFIPPEPGMYEVTLFVSDYQGRASATYPVRKVFTVGTAGTCIPTTATLRILGESELVLPSVGTYTMPVGKSEVTLAFAKVGKLTVNGVERGNGLSFANITVTSPVTLSYQSTDGTECWEKVLNPAQPPVECTPVAWKMGIILMGRTSQNTQLSTGQPSYGLDTDIDTIAFQPPNGVTGTFYLNGVAQNSQPKHYLELPVSSGSGPFLIQFKSSDGAQCWEKTFTWETQQQNECPKVWLDGPGEKLISSGEKILLPFNGSLDLYATYRTEENPRENAFVYWKIKKPDGTVFTMNMEAEDYQSGGRDRIRWVQRTTDHLYLPTSEAYPAEYVVEFDMPGTYEVWIDYQALGNSDWPSDCSWKITVEVENVLCSQTHVEATVNGQTKQLLPEEPLRLTKDVPTSVSWVVQNDADLVGIRTDWTLTKEGAVTPIKTGTGSNLFSHTFADTVDTMYTLTVRIQLNGVICTKAYTVLIEGNPCEQVQLVASINGQPIALSATGSDTYELQLETGEAHAAAIYATYKGSAANITVNWSLQHNGQVSRYVAGANPFTHTFNEATENQYTLEAAVKINGVTCTKTLVIKLKSKTCADLYLHLYDSVSGEITPNVNGTTKRIRTVNLAEWRLAITDNRFSVMTENDETHVLQAEWTSVIYNHSASPTMFVGRHTPEGTYTVTAKVTDPRYPSLQGCTFTFKLIVDNHADCSGIYLHMFDSVRDDWTYDVNGKTVTIQADKVDLLGFSLAPTVADWQSKLIDALWSGTLPNSLGPNEKEAYVLQNVAPGTYTVTAKVDDPVAFPNSGGCTFSATVVVGTDTPQPPPSACPTCQPGGEVDGGKLKLRLYDSENRLLQGEADGVWEREPVKIEVEIDQTKLEQAFSAVDDEIMKAVEKQEEEFLAKYQEPEYSDVEVMADPAEWVTKTNPLTKWPTTVPMTMGGPGISATFALNPKLPLQQKISTRTTAPNLTTWGSSIEGRPPYKVKVEDFLIDAPYRVKMTVNFKKCEPSAEEDSASAAKTCTSGSETITLEEEFTIKVTGEEATFQVFEPNATGELAHTAEWAQYHARDRYQQSKPLDFYAGERILARVKLNPIHRHPVSGKYPVITAATAWMSETGRQATPLISTLSLGAVSPVLWAGPEQYVDRLGMREQGIDTPIMGDKRKGLQHNKSASVYFHVQFGFGAQKGSAYPVKSAATASPNPYRVTLFIIGNAWERQGIRNNATH